MSDGDSLKKLLQAAESRKRPRSTSGIGAPATTTTTTTPSTTRPGDAAQWHAECIASWMRIFASNGRLPDVSSLDSHLAALSAAVARLREAASLPAGTANE